MREVNILTIMLVIALLDRQCAYGLNCFVCKSTSSSSACILEGSSETCDKTYCTIYRRELLEPEGIVTAFYRACEDNPSYLNTLITTPFHKTYYRACTSDLCNSGDGLKEFSVSAGESKTTDSILVPGIGSHANAVFPGTLYSAILIISAFMLAMYYE